MLSIQNDLLVLLCHESGRGLTIIDKTRWTRWSLNERSLVWGADPRAELDGKESARPLIPIQAEVVGQDLRLTYQAGDGWVKMIYSVRDLWIDVMLSCIAPAELKYTAFPGAFEPEEETCRLLLPIMQGMLWDGKGPNFSSVRGEAGHLGFSMPWIGVLGDTGGLLVSAESSDDALWWVAKEDSGRFWATGLQIESLGQLRYDRLARISLADSDITALAKTYRRKVIAQGRFKSWEQKIGERPYLENLFGALMCFIGYCQDDLDYAAECRKLKQYGFERALVYPARFSMYAPDILMGGMPAIQLPSAQVEAIKALGYDVAPWSWLNEALDDGSQRVHQMLRLGADGNPIPGWAIDRQQWYWACYSFLVENQKEMLASGIREMTWDHFDVLSCVAGLECYAPDHPNHLGRPMTRSESKDWVRKTFELDQKAGKIVSSESFNDAFACQYDLGSVKAWPQYGAWPFYPVPLTMLVYHDSLIHSWWEIHSYNNAWGSRTRGLTMFEYGGGRPKLMAALDALMGCPPDVFPFGAQYGYTGRGKESFLYKFRFEDPEVQIALREALPVAKLHRRTGKQEMVHFEILSEDGYLQESAFADGTRIVANFARDFSGDQPGLRGGPKVDSLGPESWRAE